MKRSPSPADLPLAVLITPSRIEAALRRALNAVAAVTGRPILAEPAEGGRCVVVLGAPEATLGEAMAAHGLDREHGLIFASQRLAAAADFAARPGVAVIGEQAFLADAPAALALLTDRLGLQLDGHTLAPAAEALARELANAPRAPHVDPTGALEAYGPTPTPARWGAELFRLADRPEERCDRPIDITGMPRLLAYGPYLTLNPGCWRATVTLEFSDDAGRRPFEAQVVTGEDVSASGFRVYGPGRHKIVVEHQVRACAPAEIRIALGRPAFHGEVTLHGAVVETLDNRSESGQTAPPGAKPGRIRRKP